MISPMHGKPGRFRPNFVTLLDRPKLVLCDFLVPYATSSNDEFSDIPGSAMTPAPYSLLPNAGNILNHIIDDGFR
ncbi:hypothetical protein PILCRDRAFT_822680 [Piloderma croceum F 1598]|uniref:Uncharacterized protein n=1 Tax=Piloderma croceum (strain F 1598) TaxID=765440 RepID=A0A0C3FKY4_PILCF|nr:hypothetical protein PILCRDRAFT_822680 [Piloderma croceum F 1598]